MSLTLVLVAVGGCFSHYNSGRNANGSGTQTKGDVNVYTKWLNKEKFLSRSQRIIIMVVRSCYVELLNYS